MKLRDQVLVRIGLVWAAFLSLVYLGLRIILHHPWQLGTIDYYLINLSILGFLSSFFVLSTVFAHRKKLQKINAQLREDLNHHKSLEKELIIHKEHLTQLAHYDALTALPNRVFFNEMLNKTIRHARRYKKMMAVLFIDLDHFKNINDISGHAAGDAALKEMAERFKSVLRSSDILARLGGDEFIILLNNIPQPEFAKRIAEKLLNVSVQPIIVDEQEFLITVSIGICIYPTDGASLEDLQRKADTAMYKAKRSGGKTWEYFSDETSNKIYQPLELESALKNAFSKHEFVLHYQPKFNLADGSLRGVEALIRWEHPKLGLINPNEFIPLAEKTGLILSIGKWALHEACRANQSWQKKGYQPVTIAVNLSEKQFYHPDITKEIAAILFETGLDPTYLELEITEAALLHNIEAAINKLHEIKNIGVKISIDDFGIGYTAIQDLKQLPIDTLKIDPSLIKETPLQQNNIAIINAIITLAHHLKIKTVAEGVETSEQLHFLANNHCDMAQGYYLSRPLPKAKIILQFNRIEDFMEKSAI